MICHLCHELNHNHISPYFCSRCQSLNPLIENETNFFIYLNLEPEFPVNKELLEHHYTELLTTYHPDNFMSNPEQQKIAAKHSDYLNRAYLTLKSPLDCISYLYTLLTNAPIELPRKDTAESTDLAKYFYAWHEELDRINQSPEDPILKQDCLLKVKHYKENLQGQIEACFKGFFADNKASLTPVPLLYAKLNFLEKIKIN